MRAKATPALTDGKITGKVLGELLCLGALHQRPRAQNHASIDYEADGEFLAALVNWFDANATALEAAEARAEAAEREERAKVVAWLRRAMAEHAATPIPPGANGMSTRIVVLSVIREAADAIERGDHLNSESVK